MNENPHPEKSLDEIEEDSEILDEEILENIREKEGPFKFDPDEIHPIEELKEENSKLKDSYLRLSAETDNYRKRINQEKENYKKIAIKSLIEKLLPVVDNLERSLKASDETTDINPLKEGVGMILSQFENALQDVGLEIIELKVGDEFDPQIGEAVMMEERDDVEFPMTVVEVFETGRKLGGQILRTTKVKVARKI